MKEAVKNELRTIDFPGQPSNSINKKRPLPLEKEEKLLLHRVTLYNRNMLGMMMAKKNHRNSDSERKSNNLVEGGYSTIDAN